MIAEQLVHLEHVHSAPLEYRLHLIITANLSLVGRVLQLVGFDVFPKFLDDVRPRELVGLSVQYTLWVWEWRVC